MFRRLRTKALLFVRARSNTTKTAFNNMPKPAWDSTNHDLSVHRISRAEVEARRQRLTSPNALAAKAELERRRALLARGSFEQTLAALADESGEAHDALRELDVVERDLRRLGDDAQTMRPPTAPVQVQESATTATPPPPAFLTEMPNAPWAEMRTDAIDAESAVNKAAVATGPPVVDLDAEIALFRQRTGQRLADFDAEVEPLAPKPPAAAVATQQEVAPPKPPPPPRPPQQKKAAKSAIPTPPPPPPAATTTESTTVAAIAGTTRKSATTPPWRPAMGQRTLRLEPPPPRHSPQVPHHEPTDAEKLLGFVEAKRAPDALGLARMQHACGDLSNLVAEYEEEIGMAPPPGGSSSKKSTVSTGPASFSNCNGQLIELTTRLVGHLKRAESELAQQAALREESEAALEEYKAKSERQADLAEAETASLRREVRLIKETYGTQIEKLTTQLNNLQTARNTNLLTSMAASLQNATPLPAPPPMMAVPASSSDFSPTPPLSQQPQPSTATVAERPQPSLFTFHHTPPPQAPAAFADVSVELTEHQEEEPEADEKEEVQYEEEMVVEEEYSAPPTPKLHAPISLTVPRPPPVPTNSLASAEEEAAREAWAMEMAEEAEREGAAPLPTVCVERASTTPQPLHTAAKVRTPSSGLAAMPAVVKCSIGPPKRVPTGNGGSEVSPPAKAIVTGVVRGPAATEAAKAADGVTAGNNTMSNLIAGVSDDPSWLNLGPVEEGILSNDERSQQVLQKYYDELSARNNNISSGGKQQIAKTASVNTGDRRAPVGRAAQARIEPTQLVFGA